MNTIIGLKFLLEEKNDRIEQTIDFVAFVICCDSQYHYWLWHILWLLSNSKGYITRDALWQKKKEGLLHSLI